MPSLPRSECEEGSQFTSTCSPEEQRYSVGCSGGEEKEWARASFLGFSEFSFPRVPSCPSGSWRWDRSFAVVSFVASSMVSFHK
jgi:hypothetical protein